MKIGLKWGWIKFEVVYECEAQAKSVWGRDWDSLSGTHCQVGLRLHWWLDWDLTQDLVFNDLDSTCDLELTLPSIFLLGEMFVFNRDLNLGLGTNGMDSDLGLWPKEWPRSLVFGPSRLPGGPSVTLDPSISDGCIFYSARHSHHCLSAMLL